MNVSLTPELEKFVNQKVESGLYSSASEVVRESLRLLEEADRIKAVRYEELKREVQRGLDDSDAGRVKPFDVESIMSEVRKRLAQEKRTNK